MFDAAIGFGGVKESGFGREGGWDGLKSYLKHSINFSANKSKIKQSHSNQGAINLDRTAKLYIGGKQVRPDGGYSQKVLDAANNYAGHVPSSNRKDIRNAVEAMNKASNWSTSSGAFESSNNLFYGRKSSRKKRRVFQAHRSNVW